jgi:hypothetical protein
VKNPRLYNDYSSFISVDMEQAKETVQVPILHPIVEYRLI